MTTRTVAFVRPHNILGKNKYLDKKQITRLREMCKEMINHESVRPLVDKEINNSVPITFESMQGTKVSATVNFCKMNNDDLWKDILRDDSLVFLEIIESNDFNEQLAFPGQLIETKFRKVKDQSVKDFIKQHVEVFEYSEQDKELSKIEAEFVNAYVREPKPEELEEFKCITNTTFPKCVYRALFRMRVDGINLNNIKDIPVSFKLALKVNNIIEDGTPEIIKELEFISLLISTNSLYSAIKSASMIAVANGEKVNDNDDYINDIYRDCLGTWALLACNNRYESSRPNIKFRLPRDWFEDIDED